MLLPDPYYPDYPSGIALAGAELGLLPLDPERGYAPRFDRRAARAASPPSSSTTRRTRPPPPSRDGAFADAVAFARETGAAIIHDFAYGDLVFDGREPRSFLAEPGAREVGVELFSMSKSYGMAGWRLGFVVGNAELVARMTTLQDHLRAGIFAPVQRGGHRGARPARRTPSRERVDLYERRRDRVLAARRRPRAPCEGTFYVWIRLPDGLTPERLLEEHRLVVAPGEGFGPSGAGWARLSARDAGRADRPRPRAPPGALRVGRG